MSTAPDVHSFYGLGRDFLSTTSIWLIDLAQQLPHAQLDGYDISSTQFPPAEWLPSNVKLKTLDALAEVPSSLVSTYDVIHAGLVVLVAGDDPVPLLRNLIKMLSTRLLSSSLSSVTVRKYEPGGYLQWDEADLGGLHRKTINPSVSKRSLDGLYELVDERFLPAGFTFRYDGRPSNGLTVVDNKFFPIPDEIAHPWTHMHLLSVGELIKNVRDSGDNAQEWWDLYIEAIEEARRGASVRMDMVVAVGRKPSN
ncbi:MAG: hypothetical protein Q9196_000232 [Gyalolechia fulgens]